MEIICLDTSVLLDYYRAKDKSQTMLYRLSLVHRFAVPTIVMYEVLRGDKKKDTFWSTFFANTQLLNFDSVAASESASLYEFLVKQNRLIDTNDILIAGTSLANRLRLATINVKDFSRVPGLLLVQNTP